MPPQHKGKAPTKGSKQILTENAETLNFYRNMSIAAGLFYNVLTLTLYLNSLTILNIFLNFIVMLIYVGCYQMMRYISKPRFYEFTKLVDPGLDLNMEGGLGEHVKDIVILSSITHVLATFSDFFWLLLLLLPMRAFYLIWKHILEPWFFQEEPEDIEQEEKKRKKMERKMHRHK